MKHIPSLKRAFLSGYCFLIFGLYSLLLGFVIIPLLHLFFILYDKEKRIVFYKIATSFFVRRFIKKLEKRGLISIVYKNKDYLKNISKTIVVSNHPSLIDIFILVSVIPNSICVLSNGNSRKDVFMRRIFGKTCIVYNNDVEVFSKSIKKALDNGFNIIMFPEGGRTVDGVEAELDSKISAVALMFNANILPIHLKQSLRFLRKSQPWYDAGVSTAYYYLTVKDLIDVAKYQEDESESQKIKSLTEKIKEDIEL